MYSYVVSVVLVTLSLLGLYAYAMQSIIGSPLSGPKRSNSRKYVNLGSTRAKGLFEWLIGGPNTMRTLAALPKELEELDISFNHDVEVLPSLPAGCKVLRAQGCSKLRKVESLPDSLEVLDLWSCDALEELPNVLPANLKVLYLAGTRITRLPASLPRELQELDARCCKNLRRGPSSYPDSLRWINYAGSGLQGNVTAQLPSKLTLEKLNRDGYVGFGLGSGRRLADLYEDVFGVGSDSGTTICHDPDEVRGIPRPRIDDGLLP